MGDLVRRLRDQGKDAFAKHYSLGMFKLCTEAADRIEELEEAMRLTRRALKEESDHLTESLEGVK